MLDTTIRHYLKSTSISAHNDLFLFNLPRNCSGQKKKLSARRAVKWQNEIG